MASRALASLLGFLALPQLPEGCSYVEIEVNWTTPTDEPTFVLARSVETGSTAISADYRVEVVPRSEAVKYGWVGFHGFLVHRWATHTIEGMNEAGLSVSASVLLESSFQTATNSVKDVSYLDVTSLLLSSSGTVEEALAFLSDSVVTGPSHFFGPGPNALSQDYPGLHYALHDATGRSVVVEYLEGERVVYENTPRVMTNDPPLDWHWQNLNTYSNLSPDFPHQNDFMGVEAEGVGIVPRAVGHGWNLFGLPGDSSAPSRFAQLFYLRGYSQHDAPVRSVNDAIVLAGGLLNKIFIPRGTIAIDDDHPIGDRPEFTGFAVVKIPREKRLLYRGYRDLQWREVNFAAVDWTTSAVWDIEEIDQTTSTISLGIKDASCFGEPCDTPQEGLATGPVVAIALGSVLVALLVQGAVIVLCQKRSRPQVSAEGDADLATSLQDQTAGS